MEVITKTLVKDNKRLDFLPHFVGDNFLRYEQMIYGGMDRFCKEYNGGYWQYYTLSNGGFLMVLDENKRFSVECLTNYYDGNMSAEAVSIGVNLYVQNVFAWEVNAERFSEAFYCLRDYAAQHDEAREIFAFID